MGRMIKVLTEKDVRGALNKKLEPLWKELDKFNDRLEAIEKKLNDIILGGRTK